MATNTFDRQLYFNEEDIVQLKEIEAAPLSAAPYTTEGRERVALMLTALVNRHMANEYGRV